MQEWMINQLPPMIMGEALQKELAILPAYHAGLMEAGRTERLLALSTVFDIYIPSEMSAEIYSKIYLAMIRALQKKEGTLAVRQRYENASQMKNREHRGIIGGSDSFSIIGVSGIGKSTAIGRALTVATGNRIIKGETGQKIIPCVICQCPHDCSVKAMLLDILRKVDEAIGTDFCEKAVKARATTDMLIGNVSTAALNHIGLLVIDEIQNVVNHRQGDSLVGMLTQLINNSGISICMVGTPETEVFFEKTDYLARRALGLRYEAMPYGKAFRDFCEIVYGYQFTKKAEAFSEGLAMWLYEHSGGVPALVVSLLHDVQEAAVISGFEIMSLEALEELYRKQYRMVKAGSTKQLRKAGKKVPKPFILEAATEECREGTDRDFSISETVRRVKYEGEDMVAELRKYISITEVAV